MKFLATLIGFILPAIAWAQCPTVPSACPSPTYNALHVGPGIFAGSGNVTIGGTLIVTGSTTLNGALSGTGFTNLFASPTPIGSTAPNTGAFTALSATGTVTLSPANHAVVISPTGTGALTINPATLSFADNTDIGAFTPRTGDFTAIGSNTPGTAIFTTLSGLGTVTLSPANLNVTISPTGSGTVTINPAGALTINPTAASTINNASVGVTTPLAVKSTTLTATGAVSLSPANANVTLSPTGTGQVVVNPATAGTMDNVAIGQTTPLAGTFTASTASTSLTANVSGNISLNATGTVAISPTGALTVNPTAASTINNTSIGQTTAAAGSFTSLTGALRNYISGLQHSAPGGATTQTFTAGGASDSTNVLYMATASTFTKTTASWAVGTGNGMLDTGASGGSAGTWYYTYVIERPDTGLVDFLMSLSSTTPTMPANYTRWRRIGAIKLDGAKNIIGHFETGDTFWLTVPINEYSAVPGVTTAVTLTLVGVPTAVSVIGMFQGSVLDATNTNSICFLSGLSQTDSVPAAAAFETAVAGSTTAGAIGYSAQIATNTSGQIRRRCSSTTITLVINLNGWIDNRGKDF